MCRTCVWGHSIGLATARRVITCLLWPDVTWERAIGDANPGGAQICDGKSQVRNRLSVRARVQLLSQPFHRRLLCYYFLGWGPRSTNRHGLIYLSPSRTFRSPPTGPAPVPTGSGNCCVRRGHNCVHRAGRCPVAGCRSLPRAAGPFTPS